MKLTDKFTGESYLDLFTGIHYGYDKFRWLNKGFLWGRTFDDLKQLFKSDKNAMKCLNKLQEQDFIQSYSKIDG